MFIRKTLMPMLAILVVLAGWITGCAPENVVPEGEMSPYGQNDPASSISTTIPSDQQPQTRSIPVVPAQFESMAAADDQGEMTPQSDQGGGMFDWNEVIRRLQEGFQPYPDNRPQTDEAPPADDDASDPASRPGRPSDHPPVPVTPVTPEPGERTNDQQGARDALHPFEQEVIERTNQERERYGLPALTTDMELTEVARAKSQDMQANYYFSHTSPTFGSPFDMMRDFGLSFRSAGENIAMGQRTPAEVVQAWMNSEGHRANILNESYTHIGVGYFERGHYWTQMFISR